MNDQKQQETKQEPSIEERLYRVEMILGLRPRGDLVFTGQLTDQRRVPGPNGSSMTVTVGGSGG